MLYGFECWKVKKQDNQKSEHNEDAQMDEL